MKRRPIQALLTSAAALVIATSFTACEKKSADQPTPPTGTTPAAPGEPAKAIEKVKAAVTTAIAPAAVDVAAISSAYGIAAMLPKDVEGFGVNYRMHDLWVKLSDSNWAKTLINLPIMKKEPKFQQSLQQWNSPQAMKGREVIESILGVEFAVVESAGFTEKFMPWVDLIGELQAMNVQRGFMTAMSGGQPPDSQKLLRESMPELLPALVKCDIPPVYFAFKAVKSKADLDAVLAAFSAKLGAKLPPGVVLGNFKVSDKYEFHNVTLDAAKLVEAMQEEKIRGQLAEIIGDEGKAKEAVALIKKKHIEIAWGWVGDYLILSLGSDHAHVKFAAGPADSALAIPAVARRASEFAAKKPLSIGYGAAPMLETLHGKLEFADAFKKVSDELSTLLKPEHIAAMQADVKKFEGKAQSLYAAKFDPMVSVSYVEGGIRTETFGGAQMTALDGSKPLAFASLLTPSAFAFTNSRSNPANDGKVADLIEDGSGMLWGWYDKYGRTMVPEDERAGAGMAEAMALPMLKDLWAAGRKLSKALGNETAFILDLNGNMPKIPNMPPAFADGKVPRIAWVAQLKDRAGVSEAWAGFSKVIKQLAAFAPGGVPDPVMKKDGDVELHYVELPVPTDDLLPHVAISKDRWIISTSPSFTKELTSKASASGGSPLGAEMRMQMPAFCTLADAWLKLVDKDPATFFHSSHDQKEYAELRPTFGDLIKLGRSIQSLEWRMFSEEGASRNSMHLKLEDVK